MIDSEKQEASMLLYGEWTLSCFLKEVSEVADMCRKVCRRTMIMSLCVHNRNVT
jgi:hypothetical protein